MHKILMIQVMISITHVLPHCTVLFVKCVKKIFAKMN